MEDFEKVVKGYECCLRINGGCKDCPYWDRTNSNKCEGKLKKDAIELLKEQQKQIEMLEYDLAIAEDNLRHYLNGNE